MKQKIYFVTSNKGKVESIKEHIFKFGFNVIQKQISLIEPQEDNPEAIALSKAMQAFKILKKPLIVEDSVFHIDKLSGFPGPYIKYILNTIGIDGLLKLTKDLKSRACRFISVLAYIDSNGVPRTFIDKGDVGTLARKIDNSLCKEAWSDLWRIFIPKNATKPLSALTGKKREEIWKEWKNNSVFTQFAKWIKENEIQKNTQEKDKTGRFLSSAFEFPIPREKIAIRPRPHGQHKLLVYDTQAKKISHHIFDNIISVLPKNTVIVVNNSKVVKAALRKPVDDGTYIHVMYPNRKSLKRIYALCPWKPRVNEKVEVNGGYYVIEDAPVPNRDIRIGKIIPHDKNIISLPQFLQKYGSIPIPIYVSSERLPDKSDKRDYQNCYAKIPGSIECPTAGLHFYPKLMKQLEERGFEFIEITLHIGYGTWKSFKKKYIDEHNMDAEEIIIKPKVIKRLHEVKKAKRPILAVGTSAVRTLESIANEIITGKFSAKGIKRETDLYINPPYNFHIVDMLLTNFAYPRTPIMVLPATFCGLAELKRIYNEALKKNYLFYTYGDSILIR